MVESFANWIVRWRWLIIIATLLLVGAAGKGMQRLTLTTDYRVFFSEENPQLLAFEALQNTYTKNDNILIVLAPKNKKVFTRETLKAVEELTEAAWQIPYSLRVDSISNFQHTRGVDDDLLVNDLYENGEDLLDSELEAAKQVAINEPLLVHRLISPAAHVTAVNVTIQVPELDRNEIPDTVEFTRALAEKLRNDYPHLDVHLTGTVMMNISFPEAAKADARSLLPLMFLVVMVALGIMLRTITGVITTILVVLFSIITAMGITGWLGVTLTPPSGSAPTIILTLAVADCVHVLASMMHSMHSGMEKRPAIIESLRVNFQPVTLTSLTTAIGFLSMNFSDAPPFRDLGNMVAMGIIAAWILSLVFLPALMAVLPVRVKQKANDDSGMVRLGEFVNRVPSCDGFHHGESDGYLHH